MADWLKVNHSLVRSAKVRGLMRALHCKKHAAFGLAVSWLCWIDEQTTDGRTGLLPEELDDEIGFRGCAEALISIGWAVLGEDGCVEAVEFGKHCGDSAKGRAENARRVAKCKANKKAKVTEEHYQGNEKTLPNELPEKKRKEYIDNIDTHRAKTTVLLGAAERPDDAEEVEAFMQSQAICGLDAVELQTCATSFFDELEAVGWVNAKGVPVRNWQAMARSYLNKWQRNCASGKGGKPITRRSEQKKNYGL